MSLLKNPNTSPSHSAHYSQSDFSKIIVSVSLIMSLPCLNPFMLHCPNAPSKESVPGSPSTLPTPVPHPTLHSCQTAYGSPNTSCSLSPELSHMLFPLSGMSTSTFYLANPKFSDFTVDMTDSRKPPLTLCSQITQHSGRQQPLSHSIMIACYLSVSPIRQKLLGDQARAMPCGTPRT